MQVGPGGGEAAAGLVRLGIAALDPQHGRQRQPGLRPPRLAGASEQQAQARHRGIEVVQVLLQRRSRQQHLGGRFRRVGPGPERGERQAGEAWIAGQAGAIQLATGDPDRELGIVRLRRELPAQALVLGAVAGRRRQHLDHLVVAAGDDRAPRPAPAAQRKRPAARTPVCKGWIRIALRS